MSRGVLIVFLGHLPSPDNRKGLRSRDQDVVTGSAQRFTDALAAALPILKAIGRIFHAAYVPTTRRHVTSGRVIAEFLGIPEPVADVRINNVDYGTFKGRPLEETPRRSDFVDTPYPGGTSWAHVAEQWRDFFEARIKQHEGEALLLPGQSGAAPVMLAHICDGVPLSKALTDPRLNVPFLDVKDPANFRSVWTYRW